MKAVDLHVDRIVPHSGNIREDLGDLAELAASIRVHGVLQPLLVARRGDKYVILAGHRRYAAAKRAGLQQVPVIIREAEALDRATEIMLVENCQRRDLNPMEKAEAMDALRNHGLTQKQIAQRVGLTLSTVNYYLCLLDLDPGTQARVRSRELPAAAAAQAVRTSRQVQRMMRGEALRGGRSQAPPAVQHFTYRHPLADRASGRCTHHKTGALILGSVACGACWEAVIREDAGGEAAEH